MIPIVVYGFVLWCGVAIIGIPTNEISKTDTVQEQVKVHDEIEGLEVKPEFDINNIEELEHE